ncbi:hypothetical protein HY214_03195 [Candidatus Roizmanbacteria bacterium]|nr:hypothetical protein [Candidatus Roizmanbacteria bacterium]
MAKIILSKDQVYELVEANKYPVRKENRFISRCIDGRYQGSSDLPPLALAGADAGELALILATGNAYGFSVDAGRAYQALVDVVGGVKNFQMDTDRHGDPKIAASGCGHIRQIRLDPRAYYLQHDQTEFLKKILNSTKKKGAEETVLSGERGEGAMVMIKGEYALKTRYSFTEKGGEVQIFVHHDTLVNERHRALAKKLIENEAAGLFAGQSEEYLYEAMSEIGENQLLETVKRLAIGLPIYLVEFEVNGNFILTEMGKV